MKLIKVAKREYLERVKKKSFLIGTILGPVIMGAVIVLPGFILERSPERKLSVAVIDSSGTVLEQFEEALGDTLPDGTPMFALRKVDYEGRDINEIKRKLGIEIESEILDGYLVISEDVFESGEVTYVSRSVGNITTLERLENALDNTVIGIRLESVGMDYDSVRSMMKGVDLEPVQLRGGEEREVELDIIFISTFIFIMMLYMTILLWGVAVQRSIIEEKSNRVIEVLLSSLRPIDLMGGKILGVGAVGLTQYAIWSICSLALYFYVMSSGAMTQYINFGWTTIIFFIVYYLLGFLFYSTLFASIGSVCNTDQEAQQLQMPVVMCLVFTIVIPVAVIQNPHGTFATVVSLIPFFTPIVMFMRINVLMPPAWQIALSIVILLGSIYIFGMLAAKIFRTGILMYGKRPDVREIVKWLKQA